MEKRLLSEEASTLWLLKRCASTDPYKGIRLTDVMTGEQVDLMGYPKLSAGTSSVEVGRWTEGIVIRLLHGLVHQPRIAKSDSTGFEGDLIETGENDVMGLESKLGTSFKLYQAENYARAVSYGKVTIAYGVTQSHAGTLITDARYYFFENPVNGNMVNPSTLANLSFLGISYVVYFVDYVRIPSMRHLPGFWRYFLDVITGAQGNGANCRSHGLPTGD